MIANFFNKSAPINMLTIIILMVFVFFLNSFTLDDAEFSMKYFASRCFHLGLIAMNLFLVNFIVRKNDLTKENTFVLFLMICCFGLFPSTTANYKLLILHFLLLLTFRRVYSLKSIRNVKEKLFDSGFWVGIISILNPSFILYFILIYASVIFHKKFTPRNFFIPILGFVTPVFIYGVYLFFLDRLPELYPFWDYNFSLYNYSDLKFIIALTLLFGFLIWTIIPATIKILTVKTEIKSTWYLLIVHVIISFILVISFLNKDGSELLFLFFPVVIIFTNYLHQVTENWFREVFLYLFLVSSVVINFL